MGRRLELLGIICLAMTAGNVSAATLSEAFQAALQKSEMAGQARERVVQAEEQYSQAKGAVYPNLTLNANHTIQPEAPNPLAREFAPEHQTTANLTLRQPLFRGLREFAGIRQRDDMLEASKQDRVVELLNLYDRVATSYMDVLALEQDMKNLGEQQKLNVSRVSELQARIRRGESSATESITAQSMAAAVDAEVELVRMRLKTARENFSYLTTLPIDTPLVDVEAASEKDPTPKLSLEQYLARVEERPDVKSAQQRYDASDEEVSVAKGAHWPTLDLLGNYYLKRPQFFEDQKWDVQFLFSLPLYEGGIRQSQVREAASKRNVAELELRRLRRQAGADIRTLFDSLKTRAEQLRALRKAAELSSKNYEVIQRDYRRGLSRNIDVQTALTDYRISRRNYDSARYLARLDLIRLETAAGILPPQLTKEL